MDLFFLEKGMSLILGLFFKCLMYVDLLVCLFKKEVFWFYWIEYFNIKMYGKWFGLLNIIKKVKNINIMYCI